jgi:hypothetical protein
MDVQRVEEEVLKAVRKWKQSRARMKKAKKGIMNCWRAKHAYVQARRIPRPRLLPGYEPECGRRVGHRIHKNYEGDLLASSPFCPIHRSDKKRDIESRLTRD